ncbi:MAG: hypothetical protein IIA51_00620 [Chloroflexi bacterium]|nr:hypothetical protein [Chloroflexota bacterium]
MKNVVGCLTEHLRPVFFLVNATGNALPYHGGTRMMPELKWMTGPLFWSWRTIRLRWLLSVIFWRAPDARAAPHTGVAVRDECVRSETASRFTSR